MMEEKIIIKSERYSIKKIFMWFAIVAVVVGLIFLIVAFGGEMYAEAIERHKEERCQYEYYGYGIYRHYGCDRLPVVCALDSVLFGVGYWWPFVFLPPLGILLIGGIFCLILKSMEIVVTDKRVYGKTYFGRMVDLPLDSVSAVGSKWMKGIAVATSSGKISFLLIKNAREIHEEIRKLLIERQEKKEQVQVATPAVAPVVKSDVEELKKYKELLDSGIITQEEFDAKKKQILGL